MLVARSWSLLASYEAFLQLPSTLLQPGARAMFVFGFGSGLCLAPCGGNQEKCTISNEQLYLYSHVRDIISQFHLLLIPAGVNYSHLSQILQGVGGPEKETFQK